MIIESRYSEEFTSGSIQMNPHFRRILPGWTEVEWAKADGYCPFPIQKKTCQSKSKLTAQISGHLQSGQDERRRHTCRTTV
jgi:hypothetical protein